MSIGKIILYFAVKKFIKWYKSEIANTISLWTAFIVLAVESEILLKLLQKHMIHTELCVMGLVYEIT